MADYKDKELEHIIDLADKWGDADHERGILIFACYPDPEDPHSTYNSSIRVGKEEALMEAMYNSFEKMPKLAEAAREVLYLLSEKSKIKDKPVN